MSIPPFPSQDLAKLVLGYLAEEQLMTAYDEFLQASPYLDALRNEYDRIFMTSLKSILAEYRAVKIYVDTCKPFELRKKIFQCTNLLDVVKFLVANVDINKILLQEATDKASLEKPKITITPKSNVCELCHSLSLTQCVCKSRQDVQQSESVSASHVDASTLQNSVETTPLADLPGSHIRNKKKNVKVLEKDTMLLNPNVSSIQTSDTNSAKQSFSSYISPEEYLAGCENSPTLQSNNNSCLSLNAPAKLTDPSKSNKNIEEFNNVLKSIVNKNKTLSGSECLPNQRISHTSTFQDFASGVSSGDSQSATYNVPDSSTSENLNARAPIRKEVYKDNLKGFSQSQLMLQVSHVNDSIKIQTCREEISQPLKLPKSAKLPKIQPKPMEKTIKIISDVKVGSTYSDKNNDNIRKKHIIPVNATSTPMQMQTIMINGTPAYKHTNTQSYTKDEIMAMPTLIVVPASGPSQTPTSATCEPIMTQRSEESTGSQSPQVLGPLVIDVPQSTAISNKPTVMDLPDLDEQKVIESGLVKTVDIKNNNITTASVPKDNVLSMETNTPQVLPPTRKSSSTPRRSSHIRVLDFTTPRRILHETINEQVPSQGTDPPVEIVLTGSANVVSAETNSETVDIKSEIIVVVNEEGNNNDSGSTKENETANKIMKQAKKYDWDADLRALIAADDKIDTTSHRKPKKKNSKKKKSIDKVNKIVDNDKSESKPEPKKKLLNKKSPRVRKSKNKCNVEELDDEPPPNLNKTNSIPCKPTIKIICGGNVEKPDLKEGKTDTESNNKSHDKADEYVNTPEAERLSLQNVIGAKLNISDLLETPYKQALYDIQMETPRFLGPDLPDEPLSDIKIMNIPTPRFLNTPNPIQATPSSYSSRPTDYSSGGSYYKPDDQDYMPIPDIICPVTSSKEDVNVDKASEKDSEEKKSRPVRQCTKNVSYYKNSSTVGKTKEVEDNVDATSSCSDTISVNGSVILKNKELTTPKTPRYKSQSIDKTEIKKRNSTNRKRNSPKDSAIKDKTKSFMKIKPRYTPKKTTGRNTKSISSPHAKGSPSLQKRKRTTSKEKLVHATPVIVSVPTKSRRKSSTPRKLNCTKSFNCESSGQDSPENISKVKPNDIRQKCTSNTQDSDTEQLALLWSDDGSQDNKSKDISTNAVLTNEIEDINKIQQFIESSDGNKRVCKTDSPSHENKNACITTDGTLQRDLMNRGFDLETAKIIERDLLDDTPLRTETTESRTLPISIEIVENKKDDSLLEKTTETDSSITNELQIVQDETDDEEIELSVHECDESSKNYFVFEHNDTKENSQEPPIKLKDNFTMEVCIDDVTMRLRATPFNLLFDPDPITVDEIDYSYKETELAVNSIYNMDRLYTPLKDSIKAQCYEIFDSTLTSIDTPLKAQNPVKQTCEASVTELVVVEEMEAKEKTEAKKRKRVRSGSNEPTTSSKRTRQDADLLLKTANIQNIDIETVLTKLHGH